MRTRENSSVSMAAIASIALHGDGCMTDILKLVIFFLECFAIAQSQHNFHLSQVKG
jgi:hypothetical protein